MSLSQEQFGRLTKEEMYLAYAELKIARRAFDNLSLQLATTIEKFAAMQNNIEKLTSELAITKNVNSYLKESVSSLQRKIISLEQYGRRENIEISGVPKNTADLEQKLVQLLKTIDVNVQSSDIVACHPLKREGTAIIRFQNRKHADLALKNAKKLTGADNTQIWGTKTINYINPNISPANLKLRWMSKKLKEANRIHRFGVDARGVWLKLSEEDRKTRVEINEDLERFIPADVSFEIFF